MKADMTISEAITLQDGSPHTDTTMPCNATQEYIVLSQPDQQSFFASHGHKKSKGQSSVQY